MLADYDYAACEIYYLKIYTARRRASLGQVQGEKFCPSPEGKRLYGEWSFLRQRYPQLMLDAFGLMPTFIHGIIAVNIVKQRCLRLELPRSINVLYSFFEIVRGLQSAASSLRPASLQRAFSFCRIVDDSNLEKIRAFVWKSPLMWHWNNKDLIKASCPALEHVNPTLQASITRRRDAIRSILVAPSSEASAAILIRTRIAEVAGTTGATE
jgi:hypothetical protein